MRTEKLDGCMVLKHQRERIYSESEVAKATNNYDDHQKLGQGGFGCVYKGVLPDYTQLAVKKFKGSQVLRTRTNRLRLAAETALALDYLRSLANPPIVHGDVKTVNILPDEDFTVKIADFGASELISSGEADIAKKKYRGILATWIDISQTLMPGDKRNIIFISSLENNHLLKNLDFEVSKEEPEGIEMVAELAKKMYK
ncbi:wall-associated receptor kinase 4-like [Populus alba]|uniref:wall-associated receptor kinase 4-like n=1 Tax=Populus alba TaxID=43335 RepID=UPI00158EEEA0|nr:wall-associated receptor kinase 3-like [Populus alba]